LRHSPRFVSTATARADNSIIERQGDGFTAKELWTTDRLGMGVNTPVLKDGLLYGLSERRKFYCLLARRRLQSV
jgi:hypothetical protein